jgi:hypothetical protein
MLTAAEADNCFLARPRAALAVLETLSRRCIVPATASAQSGRAAPRTCLEDTPQNKPANSPPCLFTSRASAELANVSGSRRVIYGDLWLEFGGELAPWRPTLSSWW